MDLSIAYSNQSVQIDDAIATLSDPCLTRVGANGPAWAIRGAEDPNPAVIPVRPCPARGLRQLSESDKETLIADFAAGVQQRVLAERYNISLSTVKRFLRKARLSAV